MNVIDALKWRYATKKFDADKHLNKDQIELLKEAFNLTATSFGLQTLKLIVVSDKDKREALVPHAYNQRQVLDASHLLVICIQDDIQDSDIDAYFDNVAEKRQTPTDILDPYRNDLKQMMTGKSIEARQEWSTRQAYIALGNLMTVCALEGIDSCPMEGFIPQKFDEVLDLRALNLKSVLLLPVGYRDEDDKFSSFKKVRKDLDQAVISL